MNKEYTPQHIANLINGGRPESIRLAIIETKPNGNVVVDTESDHWTNRKTIGLGIGLGDITESIIDTLSGGLAKPCAEKVAHLFGAKDCGCTKRKEILNKIQF